ncbi:DUF2997 domain-containing protein [Spirochaeta cellobiosiphila]|uniref:DUF2997 domain-containing protein n=1 Tax=Spirochaeta cellobiosiphila TaxID=504483 RepID=UPI000421708A|nr:DUF2997 domain-containing protein [Spirochaeta cellobiosiphila]
MAQKHELEVTISETGEVELTVKGVNGPQCLRITKELEEALGLVSDRQKTSDYYKESDDQTGHINIGDLD